MAEYRTKIQEEVRFRVLRLLKERPDMSQRELASAIGLSTGGVHYVLNALVQAGLVKLGNFSKAKDKRRYAYILTPKGIREKAAIARRFLARKIVEYDALKMEISALRDEVDAEGAPVAKVRA